MLLAFGCALAISLRPCGFNILFHPASKTPQHSHCAIRVSVDVLCALHDCALGTSPVTSYSDANSHPQHSHCDGESTTQHTVAAQNIESLEHVCWVSKG